MVATLTLLDKKANEIPEQAHPLFDNDIQLTQLQFDRLWFTQQNNQFICDTKVLNCSTWGNAWKKLHLSALEQVSMPTEEPHKILFQIEGADAPQTWLLFPTQGLLQSSAGNWYQIPPSHRNALLPVIDLTLK